MTDTRPNPECPNCEVELKDWEIDEFQNVIQYECPECKQHYAPKYFTEDGGNDYGYDEVAQGDN